MPNITPVSVTPDATTGIANRIAITSTASVENPSMKAMTQGVGNRPRSVDTDVCTLTLLRVSEETEYHRDATSTSEPRLVARPSGSGLIRKAVQHPPRPQ